MQTQTQTQTQTVFALWWGLLLPSVQAHFVVALVAAVLLLLLLSLLLQLQLLTVAVAVMQKSQNSSVPAAPQW
jgi:hypothetical protein